MQSRFLYSEPLWWQATQPQASLASGCMRCKTTKSLWPWCVYCTVRSLRNPMLIPAPVSQQVSEKDAAILQHLTDIESSDSDTGFKLVFQFSQNDFFDHATLVRPCGLVPASQQLRV